jgi:hypothetical protein
LSELVIRIEVQANHLLLAAIANHKDSQWPVHNDLLYPRVVDERLQNAESENRVEETPLESFRVQQQRAIGGHSATLVGCYLRFDQRAHPGLVVAVWSKRATLTKEASNRFGHSVTDLAFGGSIARCWRGAEGWPWPWPLLQKRQETTCSRRSMPDMTLSEAGSVRACC